MMKTVSCALRRITFFLAAIAVATCSLSAKDVSNKTYLSPRSPGVNLAQQYTTWHDHVYGKRCGKTHTSFQLTGFYSESGQSKDLGKYFGIGNDSNSFTVGDAFPDVELESRDFIHDETINPANIVTGSLSLNPRQETWGARLELFQDIHFRWAKFFISATLPVVHVKRSMRVKQVDETAFRGLTPADFFAGGTPEAHPTRPGENLQDALTKAKIGGNHSETGVADIDLMLGWKALYTKKHHLFINFGLTIPTSNKPNGEYLFAPIYGNGDHLAVGAGIDAGATLYHADESNVRLLVAGNYRFLFDNTQKRTPGFKDLGGNALPFVHYNLALKLEQPAGAPLFPAANVITQDVRVEPGSQVNALAALSLSYRSVMFDVGYDLFWREKESVKIKSWEDDTYYIADQGRDTSSPGSAASIATLGESPINKDGFDIASITTPSLLSHKIFGSLAYNGKIKKDYPFGLGVGASYEFASNNADLENWSIWLKAIFSF